VSVKSLGGKSYTTARKDDTTQEVKVYFQEKESETFKPYKRDESWIRTHKGNPMKLARMDCGGEFMSKEFIKHHEEQGTQWELTVQPIQSLYTLRAVKNGCTFSRSERSS
jgi:hypothetical protein